MLPQTRFEEKVAFCVSIVVTFAEAVAMEVSCLFIPKVESDFDVSSKESDEPALCQALLSLRGRRRSG